MAKAKIQYTCTECGAVANKWAGQCGECKAWNSMVETIAASDKGRGGRFAGYTGEAGAAQVQVLAEVDAGADAPRVATGLGELDHVLGGGLVAGSVVLIGGDPGIGKSTILLQMMARLSSVLPTLYVTGEESPQQISLRAQRLELAADKIQLFAETQVERIIEAARQESPKVMVVDSIQTIFTEQLQSAPGAVAQVRESAAQLVRYAKQTGTALFLVGHVTKEGQLAGPRVLEHMVDTVLYFEGEGSSNFRVIRAIKNRFGAVNELGVFAMTERGLKEVSNPSAIFLSRHQSPVSGSVITVTKEGSRPLLVEVQALVDESHLSNPRRVTLGLEQNRLSMLLAVLHRHGNVATYGQDVFVNVVGGVRLTETAADLPVMMAILSSLKDQALSTELLAFGEVGLAGEIRPVPNGQDRLREAAKHGFKRAIVPLANRPKKPIEGMEVVGVTRLSEALDQLWNES
ncbi:MAG: DNA repair protein RadA [Gammaproteobacteria bacterium]|nr:DNA repair protein RadA [Gammaproteobacteria bacterium]